MRKAINVCQRIAALAALMLVFGCGNDGLDLKLLPAAGSGAGPSAAKSPGADEGNENANIEGLRRRMAVREHLPWTPLPEPCDEELGTCALGLTCRDPVNDPVCVQRCSDGCRTDQVCLSNGECGDVRVTNDPGDTFAPFAHCFWLIRDDERCGVDASPTPCEDQLCAVQIALCAANIELDMAGLRSEPLVLVDTEGHFNIEIPPQSSASNVTLAQTAYNFATIFALPGARAGLEDIATGAIECEPDVAHELAATYAEAYHLTVEAVDVAVENTLAVSDSLFAENASPEDRSNIAIGGDLLSRAAAVHLLVGGDAGLPPPPTSPLDIFAWIGPAQQHFALCTQPPLTQQAESALRTLREAALSPADVLNRDLDISTLVNGVLSTGSDPEPSGSVRERLRDFWNAPDLVDATEISGQLGLHLSDFEEAREHLIQELVVFNRSTDAALPNLDLAGGMQSKFVRYAATGSLPPQRDPMYWVTVGQHQNYGTMADPMFANVPPAAGHYDLTNPVVESLALRDYGLAGVIDTATEGALELVDLLNASSADGDVVGGALDPLLLFLADAQKQRRGRLRYLHKASTDKVRIVAECFEAPAEGVLPLLLVEGEDGLECAVHGNIEGAACDLSGPLLFADLTEDVAPATACTTAVATELEDLPDKGTRLYLVEPVRPELGVQQPGNYRALASFVAPDPDIATAERWAPMVPDLADRAARILSPSRDWCARPQVSCAGESFDARLPLEDELTDDGDAVESSWRHFLELARQSAQEADLLGEEVVSLNLDELIREEQNQLRQIARAEEAIDELNNICGIDVDPAQLLETFSTDGTKDFAAMRGPPCTDTDDCGDDFGECLGGRCTQDCFADEDCYVGGEVVPRTCVSGTCAVDPLFVATLGINAEGQRVGDISNSQRLSDCLGDSEIVEFVTAGNKNLCAWVDGNNRNIVCNGALFGTCPYEEGPSGCEDPPSGKETVLVTEKLSYINLDEPFSRGAPIGLCDDIRRVRAQPNTAEISGITDSNFFDPAGGISGIGRRLRWQADYGGYSHIFVGQGLKYTTGNPYTEEATTGWPCDPNARPEVCTIGITDPADGLFCDFADGGCSDPDERARLNHRMMRAVIAARDMTIADGLQAMEGVSLPFYAVRNGVTAAPNSFTVDYADGVRVVARNVHGIGHANVWTWQTETCRLGDCDPAWLGYDATTDSAVSYPRQQADGFHLFTVGPVGVLTRGAQTYWRGPSRIPTFSAGVEFDPGWFFANLTTNYSYRGEAGLPGWGALRALLVGGPNSLLSLDLGDISPVEPLVWNNDDCIGQDGEVGTECLNALQMGLPFAGSCPGCAGRMSTAPEALRQVGYQRNRETLLDGLELLCESELGGRTDCGSVPDIGSDPHDLRLAEEFLHCIAGETRRRLAFGLFSRVPRIALDALRQEGAQGAFPQFGGDMADAVTDIRAGLVGIAGDAQSLAAALDGLANDMNTLRNSLEIQAVRDQIRSVELMSTIANQLSQCEAAKAPTIGASAGFPPSFGASVSFSLAHVAICANATAQIQFSRDVSSLDADLGMLVNQQSLSDFQRQFEERAERIADLGEQIAKSAERLDGGLATLETLRNRGRRLLARAMLMDSDVMEAQTSVNAASRARLNTSRVRYEQAQRNARRMAFIARRAIEQRLGLDLSTLNQDLPLVEAPSTWADKVCETSGFNFPLHSEELERISTHYADAYIGDYVTKLENVVESYRMVNNFHEGRDTAIISLRDDVSNARAMCSVAVDNLLHHAGQLDRLPDPGDDERGWDVIGCGDDGATEEQLPDCVGVVPLAEPLDAMGISPSDPIPGDAPDLSDVGGYLVQFGDADADCDPADCGFRTTSALAQRVFLQAGRYRLSWYGRGGVAGPPAGANPPQSAVQILFQGDDDWTPFDGGDVFEDTDAGSEYWSRYYAEFAVAEGQDLAVGIRPEPFSELPPYPPQHVYVAALMLEDVTELPESIPRSFINTSTLLEQEVPLCEDTDGDQFRRQFWTRGCVQLCDDGFASACTDTNAQTHCYREYHFSLTPRAIEAGGVLNTAGFARGNFNYRIESVGFNVVGTGVRDCEGVATPSSCYSGGFVPFSLEHLGPYRVRNYEGQDVRVELFPGVIEHARALAAERYLTNPLSSADQQLVEPYYRHEFRGRPLDGRYVLRIWEEEAVDFGEIEDVQLVLNYRYWTRFQ